MSVTDKVLSLSPVSSAMQAVYRRTNAPFLVRESNEDFAAEVVDVQAPVAHMRQITVRSEALRTFERIGADEYVGLYMPPAGVPLVLPPEGPNPRAAILEIPEETRPTLRWYTVAEHRPEDGEIDIIVVFHGDSGPGSAWFGQVQVGDPVGVHTAGALYVGGEADSRELLVADESSLPALTAITRSWKAKGSQPAAQMHVEVPDESYLVEVPDGATVHLRGEHEPGSVVLAAIQAARFDDLDYAWISGESTLVTNIRRHLVKEVGVSRRAVSFSTYWIVGKARP